MDRIHSSARVLLVAAVVAGCKPAWAHPHILITVRSEIVFAVDGKATAFRQTWTYDPAYSAFITREFHPGPQGELAVEELTKLAKSQVQSFDEYEYFTSAKLNGLKIQLGDPTEYGLTQKDGGRLVLRLAWPLTSITRSDAELVLEVFDPNFFAYFTLAEGEGALHLVGAPAGCQASVNGPKPIDLRNTRSIPAVFWQALNDGDAIAGQQFVNRIVVTCP